MKDFRDIFTGKFSASKWAALGECLMTSVTQSGPGVRMRKIGNQTIISAPRRGSRGGSSATPGPCPFGEIYQYKVGDVTKTGIRGGWVEAGDKIWPMEPYEINLDVDGTKCVWIKIAVTANTDPDDVATIPGLKTSSAPSWESGETYGTKTIPEMFPTGDPGKGTAIAAIGEVTVLDGRATIAGATCGNIVAAHCPGTLTTHRYGEPA